MSAACAIVRGLSASRTVTSTGPGRELDGLRDQRQPVLVVAVEDHEREVGVLARDQLGRLRHGHRERRHLVAERVEHVARARADPPRARWPAGSAGSFARRRYVSGHVRQPSSTLSAPRPRPPPDGPQRPRPRRDLPSDERESGLGASGRSTRRRRRAASISRGPRQSRRRARAPIARCSSARTRGDQLAREQLVQRFLPLARQLARRYQRGGEPLDDLIQVASLGLLKAIDRFDPTPRDRVLELRRPDHPRRAQAPLPRQGLVGARPARPAGARGPARAGRARRSRASSAAPPTPAELAERARRHASSRCSRRARPAGAYRAVSLDRPRDDDEERRRHRRRVRRSRTRASARPRTPRRSST